MIETITTDEVEELLAEGEVPLIYVMSEKQYGRGHIPGSISIPEADLRSELPDRFDKSDPIALYCASESCQASERAARKVESLGFETVLEYTGGLAMWGDEGLPVQSGFEVQKPGLSG